MEYVILQPQKFSFFMKKGDYVSVLDDVISGIVTEIDKTEVTIETSDGFPMTFPENELVVMNDTIDDRALFSRDVSEVISEKTIKKNKNTKRVKPKERVLPPMVVDLHIHQLVPKSKGLSNYEMLNIQMDTAKRQLEFAINKRIQRLVFIHGVGEGVLRSELEFLLNRYENIQFYDADFQKYGRGATEVYIFQSKTPS